MADGEMDAAELKHMIMTFRVSELQVLLGYAGRNKSGRKQDLMTRALGLVRNGCSLPIQLKIKELYRRRFPRRVNLSPSQPSNLSHSSSNSNPSPLEAALTSISHQAEAQRLFPNHIQSSSLPPHLPPVHPDVTLKRLPFYDIIDELIKPTSLVPRGNSRFQETYFVFHLTPQQAAHINSSRDCRPGMKPEYNVQVQLRFCLLETSCEQEDHFPPSICVKINSKLSPLPGYIPQQKAGAEQKRPSRPINITNLCRMSPTVPNHVNISWAPEYGRGYTVSVYLVRQLSASILLNRLRGHGIRNADHSRAMIKEKLQHDPDSEIATTSLRVSLLCPLGKMRMTIPCRPKNCTHLQCFDASLYLQMNEKKPTWICPVCDSKAPFDDLIIDGLFTEILQRTSSELNEIQFFEDGSWHSIKPQRETCLVTTPTKSMAEDLSMASASASTSQDRQKYEIIDLTLDDSSDEDDDDSVIPTTKDTGTPQLVPSPAPRAHSRSMLDSRQPYAMPMSSSDFMPSYPMPPLPPEFQGMPGLDLLSLLQNDSQHESHHMPGLDLLSLLQNDTQFGQPLYLDPLSSSSGGSSSRSHSTGQPDVISLD
ncbi:PREDICTED: E3 SUMO-protein ligase PIAS3-like isoform X2 [Branchiostoma belcheri]|uniref:E3 SUMO-protein ligase PIAS3-like isoform X2 n=1 Tax=Branchiostoma belcheri TaxID=7741 RepID=A0A6P4YQS0_BRABE|nr:PREDICTED: E3 SUMO-protein ligase PIAS3-like isoform X2 [Branchiostoma belcheri]